jgi:3-phosphoshikimate 1-carboxyvinyltransferase
MRLEVEPAGSPLRGELTPPGDKSISHRALILSALATGRSRISGLLEAADTLATRAALEQMGARFESRDGALEVEGLGAAGLRQPEAPLDMGNSGTAMRLLAGVLAAQPFRSVLVGDASLSRRPMQRIIKPLRMMGARIEASADGTAPLVIRGAGLQGVTYESPVASAQVKSCVLLAGLYAQGETRVIEPALSRDHTERMLPAFGVTLPAPCTVVGGSRLKSAELAVPADPSSAAFPMVAAMLVTGSQVRLRGVGLNPTRDGFLRAVRAMGAAVQVSPSGGPGEEPVGDILVRHRAMLAAMDLPPDWIPSMIDELPALMVVAARARGTTRIRGAAELRVKESDRIAVMCEGLRRLGVTVREYPDGADISGTDRLRSAELDAAGDHRCAMSLAVLGLVTPGGVRIRGAEHIDTSYPGFVHDMSRLGATLAEDDGA